MIWKNKLNKILSTKLKNYILYLGKYYARINFDFFLPQASADRVILRLEKLQFTANWISNFE